MLVTVGTYNVLAASLGSNTIPWVTDLPPDLIAEVDALLRAANGGGNGGGSGGGSGGVTSWAALLRGPISSEYKRHFHKNWHPLPPAPHPHAADSSLMRRLWAQPDLGSNADLDPLLRGAPVADDVATGLCAPPLPCRARGRPLRWWRVNAMGAMAGGAVSASCLRTRWSISLRRRAPPPPPPPPPPPLPALLPTMPASAPARCAAC